MYVQSGIGNLGTESVFDVHRVAAEIVGMPWEKVEITWGNTAKYLPSTCNQGGSQTTHAMTRAAHAAGMDAKRKLQEVAAKTLGGSPDSYQVSGGRVSGGGRSMTLAQAAQKAIELGGRYDGHELPEDINAMTKASATALSGQGLMGVARDNYGRDGTSKSYVAGFAEVEVDVETGLVRVLKVVEAVDCGQVVNPQMAEGQVEGAAVQSIGYGLYERMPFDADGRMAFRSFRDYTIANASDVPELVTILVPTHEPTGPFGAKAIAEIPINGPAPAIANAVFHATGARLRALPLTPDRVWAALAERRER
jgi:xanthine dehydrogenase molybdenum-binding subunit